ncbi:MAG: prephenate dehydrogenase [Oscillospiraceae bacterium]|jgi:prephenate dehydrogenase|nr:prephenate dehydrogenase [Oscillospiraceae bacterium]
MNEQERPFVISILGVGLMGGSLAMALRGFGANRRALHIIGYDPVSAADALALRAIDEAAATPEQAVQNADVVFYCSSPNSILRNMRDTFSYMKSGCVASDICGVKTELLEFIENEMPRSLHYVGIHPMAGRENSGFINASAELYMNAGFLLIPSRRAPETAVRLMRDICVHIGARRVLVNTAEEHDRIIGYTSDLMHIAATALCEEYPPNMTMAHTAGAFRDCTRVAHIDAELWTELLLLNGERVRPHLRRFIQSLESFERALASEDAAALRDLLSTAAANKEAMQRL